MKSLHIKINKLLTRWVLTICLFLCVVFSFAQPPLPQHQGGPSVTSQIHAEICVGLTLTETHALDFGTMSVPSGAVNVQLTTSTNRIPSIPANIQLFLIAPFPANAAYTVLGYPGAAYTISLPPDNLVTITEGTTPMHVDGFMAKTASAGVDGLTGTLDGSGNDSFVVGGTLKLISGQPIGLYTGTFDVTVNYY